MDIGRSRFSKENNPIKYLPWFVIICLFALFLLLGILNPWDKFCLGQGEAPYQEITAYKMYSEETDAYAGIRQNYIFTLDGMKLKGQYLGVYLTHQYVAIYLKGELVYKSAEPEEWHFGKSSGGYWAMVPLDGVDDGGEIQVVVTSIYSGVSSHKPLIVTGTPGQMVDMQMRRNCMELLASIMLFFLGTLFAVLSFVLRFQYRDRLHTFFLGCTALFYGMWRFRDLPLTPMLLRNTPIVLYDLSMFGLLVSTMLFLLSVRFRESKDVWVYRWLSRVTYVEVIAILILQVLNIRDIRECLPVIHTVTIIVMLTILIYNLHSLLSHVKEGGSAVQELFPLVIVISALVDTLRYYLLDGTQGGSLTLWLLTCYVLIIGVLAIRESVRQQTRLQQIQVELAKERTLLMLGQIQPHFLYNSLAVIQHLCRKDPTMAEIATEKFSRYLRRNMDSLTKDTLVMFEDELEHTRNYLDLEQLRFGSLLKVRYEIGCTAFRLPTLTLQPIVENAVRHGVRKNIEGGTVTIVTKEFSDRIEIAISDDGPGFEHEKSSENEKSHIGLQNVGNRLRENCGGELRIETMIGEGTTVLIILPKESCSL